MVENKLWEIYEKHLLSVSNYLDIIEVVSDYVYLGIKKNFNNTLAKL